MDANTLKENIFSENETLTADQSQVMLKAMIEDFCTISDQEEAMAVALDSIQHELIAAEKIESYKKLSRTVAGIRQSLELVLMAHRHVQLASADRLKRALRTIDPIAGRDQSPVQ